MKNPRKVFTPTLLINPSLGLQPAPCTRPEATFWFHRTAAFLHYVATPCYAYFSTALHAIHCDIFKPMESRKSFASDGPQPVAAWAAPVSLSDRWRLATEQIRPYDRWYRWMRSIEVHDLHGSSWSRPAVRIGGPYHPLGRWNRWNWWNSAFFETR